MQTTVNDYNSTDRALEMAIDIYFDGLGNAPFRCKRNDHLISCTVLDEACSNGDTFIGTPSSNECSFTLLGENGLFNPTNTDSPLYGKIKTGLIVKAFIRPIDINEEVTYDWDPLGVFYITDWTTDITGVSASVVANDLLYTLFNSNKTKLEVISNCTYNDLFNLFCSYNRVQYSVKGSLANQLLYGYIVDNNSEFIKAFSIGSLSYIYCEHDGSLCVNNIDRQRSVDYTLTDSDQVISISTKQSATLNYDGVSLTYVVPYISDIVEVITNKEQSIGTNGINVYTNQEFSKKPLLALTYTDIEGNVECDMTIEASNALDISYSVKNNSAFDGTFKLSIFGNILEDTKFTIDDEGTSLLKLENKYIQDATYAERFSALLRKYIRLRVPKLELEVRGNPKYSLGDKLRVLSDMYSIDFTGILIKQQFKYDGGLKASMTLLNSEVLGD